jgi:hypothetical protein
MMWLSQLAYETDDEGKVDSILGNWQLTKLGFKSNDRAPVCRRTAPASWWLRGKARHS